MKLVVWALGLWCAAFFAQEARADDYISLLDVLKAVVADGVENVENALLRASKKHSNKWQKVEFSAKERTYWRDEYFWALHTDAVAWYSARLQKSWRFYFGAIVHYAGDDGVHRVGIAGRGLASDKGERGATTIFVSVPNFEPHLPVPRAAMALVSVDDIRGVAVAHTRSRIPVTVRRTELTHLLRGEGHKALAIEEWQHGEQPLAAYLHGVVELTFSDGYRLIKFESMSDSADGEPRRLPEDRVLLAMVAGATLSER